ncbi:MAG TPA: hypothetical protein VJM33_07770 [Microthrixaceae bacterium]|nr:hypothetical protein [Microthrixaceae bacterium]
METTRHTTRQRLTRLLFLSVPAVIALSAIAACTPALDPDTAFAVEFLLLAPVAWLLAQLILVGLGLA